MLLDLTTFVLTSNIQTKTIPSTKPMSDRGRAWRHVLSAGNGAALPAITNGHVRKFRTGQRSPKLDGFAARVLLSQSQFDQGPTKPVTRERKLLRHREFCRAGAEGRARQC